jgi:hypothetical protein
MREKLLQKRQIEKLLYEIEIMVDKRLKEMVVVVDPTQLSEKDLIVEDLEKIMIHQIITRPRIMIQENDIVVDQEEVLHVRIFAKGIE